MNVMLNWDAIEKRLIYHPLPQILVAGMVGLVLGFAITLAPPRLVFFGTLGLIFTPFILNRPEFIVLGIVLSMCTIFGIDMLPPMPVIESIKLTDPIFFAVFGLVIMRWLAERDFNLVASPLNFSLMGFFCMALFSTTVAYIDGNVELWEAFEELRIVAYYLTFFVVLNLVRTDTQIRTLIYGLFLLAVMVAGFMVAQFIVGDSIAILPGRVEALRTETSVYSDITRILPPGQSIVLLASITLSVVIVLRRMRLSSLFLLALWGLITTAVVITFNRSFWIGTFLGIGLLGTQVRGPNWQRYMAWGATVGALILVGITLLSFQPDSQVTTLASASAQRFLTVFTGGGALEDSSFQWRYPEYEHGLQTFASHPIIGIGFGTAYRPYDPRIDQRDEVLTHYTHNGHLWIVMKSGLIGYCLLVGTVLLAIRRGFKHWHEVDDPLLSGIVLGFSLTLISALVANIVTPIFMELYWTPILGVMLALIEIIIRLNGDETRPDPVPARKPQPQDTADAGDGDAGEGTAAAPAPAYVRRAR